MLVILQLTVLWKMPWLNNYPPPIRNCRCVYPCRSCYCYECWFLRLTVSIILTDLTSSKFAPDDIETSRLLFLSLRNCACVPFTLCDAFFYFNVSWHFKWKLIYKYIFVIIFAWRSEIFMGLCFSCRKSRLENLKSEQFSASATPLHVCVEDQRGPELGSSSKEICHYTRMANTISNLKMANPIKNLVSKRRKRYTKDGFNLDLTCILSLNNPVLLVILRINQFL